ncbi:redox-regulated ATPase YchF [bacterium CG17_big_fil_post_rev_8_21_14_2_50_64_8]|nr:MAG: redox-regulated ATPase YchF [bacterium CG17_big_fil_post_rev_8_21_14_2_50_64_8]PJA73600.1 MAG: redox-regulated ATPase YchF [bacterium CG_4_9_14_3_um_filter_65_15]
MQIGIIGMKFTGKTTLFNAITGAQQPTGQGGVEAHRAVGKIPDPRLDVLTEMFKPKRTVHATVEWVDIPGFAGGAGPDGGREATRFLELGRKVDALAQVVRCFDGGYGEPAPLDELESMALELILTDLQVVENRLEKLAKDKARMGKVANPLEPPCFERLKDQLEDNRPLRELDLNPDETKLVSGFAFLTLKPLMVILNHPEGEEPGEDVRQAAADMASEVVSLCANVEEELAQLDPAEAGEFLADLGIEEPALALMIRAAYGALDQQSFFTVGPDECRAWTVGKHASAPEAAGAIHSDLQRGFIRAEVTAYDDLVAAGSLAAAKAANKVRLEGKAYAVQDGDIIEIRFSV